MQRKKILFLLLCSFIASKADQVGSDTAVYASPHYLFPTNPMIPNRIAYFTWMLDGFTLKNAFTSVLFDSVFPVSGNIQLNGGTLNLNRDLSLNNQANILGLGTINGNGHILSFSQNVNSLPLNASIFTDTRIFLNNDVVIKGPITFQNTCPGYSTIEGNGHKLIFDTDGSISIDGNLILKNIILDGISGTNLKCLSDDSLLQLDSVTWIQADTFAFQTGSLKFQNIVTLQGSTTFIYETDQVSCIDANARLFFDIGFTFSYDPNTESSTLLKFTNETAKIILNGATLHASTTLELIDGSVIVNGDSSLSSDNDIIFGNGSDDFGCVITPGSILRIDKGALNYNNIALSSWLMENSLSKLILGQDTILRLYQTLDIGSGLASFEDFTTLARTPSSLLVGSTIFLGTTTFEIL